MDLSEAMAKLSIEETEDNQFDAIGALLKVLEEDIELYSVRLDELGVLAKVHGLLQKQHDRRIEAKLANLVAELAKNENLRGPCVKQGFVPPLNNYLKGNDVEVLHQTCRALGNLCCDYDPAREAINEAGGVQSLVHILKTKCLSGDHDPANERFRVVACAYLTNLTFGNEILQSKAISEGLVDTLVQLLKEYSMDIALCGKIVICVGNLADVEANKVAFVGTGMGELLVNALQMVVEEDEQEALLEVVASLAENDEMKQEFTQANLVPILLEILQGYKDLHGAKICVTDDDVQVEKLATDIIVLLVTEDVSMTILFDDGKGLLYQHVMSSWLPSSIEVYQISGALVLGNFARNDGNCLKLLDLGVLDPLFKMLEKVEGHEMDVRLQHAVLSALRNLSVPKLNKARMLDAGTLEAILPLLVTERNPVQFKLLGTARLLIDGAVAAAVKMGTNADLVERVAELCSCEVHAGVAGEANRLLAALIKNSASKEVMQIVIDQGGIEHLVKMAMSEHTLMQNEALIALTLVASSNLGMAVLAILSSDLIGVCKAILTNEGSAAEIKCNVLSLISFLTESDSLQAEIKAKELVDVVNGLCDNSNEVIKGKAMSVSQHFR
ncbi:rap1 GTPase-GDP dissociation stimulator 1-like isoform X2 [Anneissia japonica]|uniref:rap1 GTPase-GDP dissociation stimulator 1-like isoform X2 n=1 Tax=Anneissia japonica TaxID=1529436 RepID=UPI001425925C|nr:rap1 GTPase-GDP dissociation stimulator 1-like isoform X2 [Anneissia japonica]